ncbi:hypothetical protein BN961_01198 [Afipia felis]|uniref:Uncharacterized protein n=1 Tax=Afipia felis TaxID=1035 RepID=A0A090MJZ0_AFIFE|nr:hypothetical protein BN961_01198 [Afipia felis]
MRHRRGMHPTRHEACEVRHVHHEIRTDAVGDLAKALEVPRPRIGRAARDDELRLHFLRLLCDRIHIDELILAPHGVVLRREPLARHVHRRTVGEMATRGKIEAHEGIAGLEQRQEHRLVHLAAGVRLHVGEIRAEQLLGALDRQRFHHVDPFAAAVIALARIAFRVLVGEHRALRLEHGAADDIFGRDQLDLMLLAAEFALDGIGDLGISLAERGGEEGVWSGSGFRGRRHWKNDLHRGRRAARSGENESERKRCGHTICGPEGQVWAAEGAIC